MDHLGGFMAFDYLLAKFLIDLKIFRNCFLSFNSHEAALIFTPLTLLIEHFLLAASYNFAQN
jgi:hypothetical protein